MKDATLMLASFEKTNDILFEAAYMSKGDILSGVTESIIVVKIAYFIAKNLFFKGEKSKYWNRNLQSFMELQRKS